jgi:hypothetical protein
VIYAPAPQSMHLRIAKRRAQPGGAQDAKKKHG